MTCGRSMRLPFICQAIYTNLFKVNVIGRLLPVSHAHSLRFGPHFKQLPRSLLNVSRKSNRVYFAPKLGRVADFLLCSPACCRSHSGPAHRSRISKRTANQSSFPSVIRPLWALCIQAKWSCISGVGSQPGQTGRSK